MGGTQRTLDGIEFLRRFTMHILPKRFVKIRRYGIYNHTVKRNMSLRFTSEKQGSNKPNEKSLSPETKQQRFERLTGVNLSLCRVCKTGRMITVRELPRIRSPGWSFLSFQNTNSSYVTSFLSYCFSTLSFKLMYFLA